jgi:hypothetical protein
MKTVAVCISGQFRSFDKCLPSIFKNLILTNSNYELKFFTSFAKEEDKPINIPADFFKISSVIKIEEDSVLPDLSYQKSKYKYQDYQLDSENDPKLIYYQLKQFQSVFNMVKEYEKDNNMTFDYVMRLRPDLEFKSIFNWKSLGEFIITPSEDHFRGYNDRFAIINITKEELPLKVRICCGKEVIYSKALNVPPNLGCFVGSQNKCTNKKVIFQGNDLYLEYKMN